MMKEKRLRKILGNPVVFCHGCLDRKEHHMKNKALHWLVVGFVSDGAKAWIEEEGGKVVTLHNDPLLIGVALAYDAAGTWVWSKGRQVYRNGVEYWSTGELQEASTGITLLYGNVENEIAEYCSAETNYLILPDETFDKTAIRQIAWNLEMAQVTEVTYESL
jgi:hypothetical protein